MEQMRLIMTTMQLIIQRRPLSNIKMKLENPALARPRAFVNCHAFMLRFVSDEENGGENGVGLPVFFRPDSLNKSFNYFPYLACSQLYYILEVL